MISRGIGDQIRGDLVMRGPTSIVTPILAIGARASPPTQAPSHLSAREDLPDPRPAKSAARSELVPPQAHLLDTGITVSRAPARASRALSRRFRGWIALLAPLRVYRPTNPQGVTPKASSASKALEDAVDNQIDGTIPPQLGQLTKLKQLRVPPASPTPGAARDRPSASQGTLQQQDLRHVPARSLRRPVLLRQG